MIRVHCAQFYFHILCEAETYCNVLMMKKIVMLVGIVQNDIRKNPTFRTQFHEMCAKVGVDPLASNKGFWAELLGIGDFYYELGECRGHSLKFINPSYKLYSHLILSSFFLQ